VNDSVIRDQTAPESVKPQQEALDAMVAEFDGGKPAPLCGTGIPAGWTSWQPALALSLARRRAATLDNRGPG
jgi:hypothetical protein